MRKFLVWLGRNGDPIAAVAVAVVVAILGMVSTLGSETTLNGVLAVLAVLSVAILRDRARRDDTEQQLHDAIHRAAGAGTALAAVQAEMAAMRGALADMSVVRVVQGADVKQELARARASTTTWIFRGGTGTFIRAVTLPDCIARARVHRSQLHVKLEIIDPSNVEVCRSYAQFRRSVARSREEWTQERAQRESFATILAACWHIHDYDLLDISIALSQTMPTLRWDMSDNILIITQESPLKPALLSERGKLLFDYTETELRRSFDQARPVQLKQVSHLRLGSVPDVEPSIDEVRALFDALHLPVPNSFIDDDVVDIVRRALHAEDPYGP